MTDRYAEIVCTCPKGLNNHVPYLRTWLGLISRVGEYTHLIEPVLPSAFNRPQRLSDFFDTAHVETVFGLKVVAAFPEGAEVQDIPQSGLHATSAQYARVTVKPGVRRIRGIPSDFRRGLFRPSPKIAHRIDDTLLRLRGEKDEEEYAAVHFRVERDWTVSRWVKRNTLKQKGRATLGIADIAAIVKAKVPEELPILVCCDANEAMRSAIGEALEGRALIFADKSDLDDHARAVVDMFSCFKASHFVGCGLSSFSVMVRDNAVAAKVVEMY